MEQLIEEMTLQEMQETFGGAWVRIIIDGEIVKVWKPDASIDVNLKLT